MGKKFLVRWLSIVFILSFAGIAAAQYQHSHGSPMPAAPQKDASPQGGNQPVQAMTVEGFKVSFEVMDMSMHMSMPGMKGNAQHGTSEHSQSHALMVRVQDTASKEIISDAKVQYTFTRPSAEKENGKLAWSGDHYDGGFSPKEKGAYQFQLMIESGGMEREARFRYEFK